MASEAKAFLAMDWQPEWDVGSIVEGGWLHDDRTLFRGVRKLPAGHWMEITPGGEIKQRRYWDLEYSDKVCSRLPCEQR